MNIKKKTILDPIFMSEISLLNVWNLGSTLPAASSSSIHSLNDIVIFKSFQRNEQNTNTSWECTWCIEMNSIFNLVMYGVLFIKLLSLEI